MPSSVQTKIVQDKASLSNVRKAIRADMTRVGIDPSKAFDCLVAVTEACTNALLYGTSGSHGIQPQIAWRIDAQAAYFWVQDHSSQEWSRAAHPSRRGRTEVRRTEEKNQAFEKEKGYGLEIMSGLMDEVDIASGPGGTTVALVKRFTS
ncbi:MAG: ATP-binding protein [Actinomycetota bacterium]|nr:ATP-binding protein [Actinomycetota bacterium]